MSVELRDIVRVRGQGGFGWSGVPLLGRVVAVAEVDGTIRVTVETVAGFDLFREEKDVEVVRTDEVNREWRDGWRMSGG